MALKTLLTNLEQGLNAYPNHNTPSTSGGFNYGQSTTRIFDSKTFRQRDFKFGEGTAFDRPGNEFSREPLIGRNIDIPGPNDQPGAGGFLNLIGSLTDGFVRGGIVTAIERSAQDVARLTKFYLTSRGIGFLAKQTALQLTNPRIPTMDEGASSTSFLGLEFDRNRTFNLGLNILAQAGVNFSGIHFDRSGITPVWPEDQKYEKTTIGSGPFPRYADNNNFGTINRRQGIVGGNRLLALYDSAILGNKEGTSEDEKGKIGKFFEGIGDKVKELTGRGGEELYAYNGGPDSLYGIGKTRILRATNTRTDDLNVDYNFFIPGDEILGKQVNNEGVEEDVVLGKGPEAGYIPSKYRNVDSAIQIYVERVASQFNYGSNVVSFGNRDSSIGLGLPEQYTDPYLPSVFADERFGFQRFPDSSREAANKLGILTYNWQTKYDPSDPNTTKFDFRALKRYQGIHNIAASDYQKLAVGNKARFFREERVNTGNPGQLKLKKGFAYNVYDPKTIDKINALDVIRVGPGGVDSFSDQAFRDLIRFRIEAIDADNPLISDTMVFRAFLDDYSDNFDASWNSFTYNGRGEELYTYQGFKRSVSFSFKIAAQSRHEMMPLYRKLNFLVSQTAPDYKGTRMRGNFVKVTIGSLLDRTPGIINSVKLQWQKDYPWEINIDGPEQGRDKEMQVLPHVLDVSVQFTPVHNFIPKKSVTDSPFIFKHERNGSMREEEKWYKKGVATTLEEASPKGQRNGMGDKLLDISTTQTEAAKIAAEKAKERAQLDAQARAEEEARIAEEKEAKRQAQLDAQAEADAALDDYFDDIDWDEWEEDEYDMADENQVNNDLTLNQDRVPPRIEPKPIKQISTGVSLPTNLQKSKEAEWKKEKRRKRQAALNARGNVRT